MTVVSRKIGFFAAHHYWYPGFSEVENLRVFGACANREGHGHNYQVSVSVAGPVCERTGMVINFYDLDPILERVIREPLDHKNLNTQVDFFQDKIPTLENLTAYLWGRLKPEIEARGLSLCHLRVSEHPGLYAEFDGVWTEGDAA